MPDVITTPVEVGLNGGLNSGSGMEGSRIGHGMILPMKERRSQSGSRRRRSLKMPGQLQSQRS
jgi:hypothetical protein